LKPCGLSCLRDLAQEIGPAERNLPLLRSTVFLAQKMGKGLGRDQILLPTLPPNRQGKAMTTLRLILDDQPNSQHSWLSMGNGGVLIITLPAMRS
jgi:hypothetical protein